MNDNQVKCLILKNLNSPEPLEFSELLGEKDSVEKTDFLSKIEIFKGIITKIKHSFIWSYLPKTSSILFESNLLEKRFIEFSQTISLTRQSQKKKYERSLDFIRFLIDIENERNREESIIGILIHEKKILEYSCKLKQREIPKKTSIKKQILGDNFVTVARTIDLQGYKEDPEVVNSCSITPINESCIVYIYNRSMKPIKLTGLSLLMFQKISEKELSVNMLKKNCFNEIDDLIFIKVIQYLLELKLCIIEQRYYVNER